MLQFHIVTRYRFVMYSLCMKILILTLCENVHGHGLFCFGIPVFSRMWDGFSVWLLHNWKSEQCSSSQAAVCSLFRKNTRRNLWKQYGIYFIDSQVYGDDILWVFESFLVISQSLSIHISVIVSPQNNTWNTITHLYLCFFSILCQSEVPFSIVFILCCCHQVVWLLAQTTIGALQ